MSIILGQTPPVQQDTSCLRCLGLPFDARAPENEPLCDRCYQFVDEALRDEAAEERADYAADDITSESFFDERN